MTQCIVRLATADDRPEVLRLQEQFIAELVDPLGVAEGSHDLAGALAADQKQLDHYWVGRGTIV